VGKKGIAVQPALKNVSASKNKIIMQLITRIKYFFYNCAIACLGQKTPNLQIIAGHNFRCEIVALFAPLR